MIMSRNIEEFDLHETIGSGTVGSTHRATDLTNQREVALKILLPSVSDDQLILARFERETLILEKLCHPHIVTYYGAGTTGKQLFYAMELVTGGSLKQVLAQDRRLPWQEVAVMAVQICSALQHAHNYGIIHRDVKPANLLFTPQGDIKLSDFGIALDANAKSITQEGLTVGSYLYMPPEQIHGERVMTGHADLYALGCVLFESITGCPPYPGENFAQIFEQHLHRDAPHACERQLDVPAAVDKILVHLMAKKPEQRPFNARAVQATFMRILESTTDLISTLSPGIGKTAAVPDHDNQTNDAIDVAASDALNEGRTALGHRIQSQMQRPRYEDVSWRAMMVMGTVILGLVFVGWWLAT